MTFNTLDTLTINVIMHVNVKSRERQHKLFTKVVLTSLKLMNVDQDIHVH